MTYICIRSQCNTIGDVTSANVLGVFAVEKSITQVGVQLNYGNGFATN